ncbi:MAG: prepilin-type N-terminal cleavage/methylation domain-containing protein [Rubrivivax sp.]|nr:prepilin-type N-terminal cleavage/methylation domain-containing protein [Rubrivivax sp.]
MNDPKPRRRRGFTLLELLVVLLLVALASGVMVLALRDGEASALEREASRLAALLEMARAESRVSGTVVAWQPGNGVPNPLVRDEADFRFAGLTRAQGLPQRWLQPGAVQAQVVAAESPGASGALPRNPGVNLPQRLWLGPDAILPPQAVELRLGRHRVRVASDGLGPFQAGTVGADSDVAAR